ncbi:hypothetical protein [Bacillus taeanensis]|uniref:hypothetical protein n=1 Tax=Bacillus taeanensis TaxID=273032 RepID=UPI001FE85920|nr:hypothetical protein [Bacillus taeanensis]
MGCEVCLPSVKGYTVYFAENESAKTLNDYFQNSPEESWNFINNRMFWVKEPVFFDLIDYAQAHFESQ